MKTLVADVPDFFEFYQGTQARINENDAFRQIGYRTDQRNGQLAYNDLTAVRPDLTRRIIAEKLYDVDPFNNDVNLPAFWEWLIENWEK